MALEDQNVPHAILFEEQGSTWERWSFNHRLAGVASYRENGVDKLLTVGVDGFIQTVEAAGARNERIIVADGETGPSQLSCLHCLRIIGNYAYVAGNARQVFRRELSSSHWTRWDQGCVVPRSSNTIASFHAIDGSPDGWLIAVGLKGEIWTYAQDNWQALASPTNIRLEAVRHTGERSFIAAGAQGIVLLGHEMRLRILEHNLTSETFASIEIAFGDIYLCTEQGNLFRLNQHYELVAVDTGFGQSLGGGQLAFAEGRLVLSFDLYVLSFDGTNWSQITPI